MSRLVDESAGKSKSAAKPKAESKPKAPEKPAPKNGGKQALSKADAAMRKADATLRKIRPAGQSTNGKPKGKGPGRSGKR